MNAMNLIAGLALACLATGSYAQSCAGHAHASATTSADPVATVAKEIAMTPEQTASFRNALAACEKDCSAMATADTKPEMLTEKKKSRFDEAVTSMKTVLNGEQYEKLQAMNAKGELTSLCGSGGKGCCAGKASAKGGCCSGKAGAHSEKKSDTGGQTIQ